MPNTHTPPFVVAIDIGSSSIRASLFDAQGQAVDGLDFKAPHTLHADADGAAEELPEHVLERVNSVIDSLLAAAGPYAQNIAGVGMDALASTVLGLDSRGRPVTPIYTYADTRSGADVERLRRELDGPAVYQRTGCPIHSAYVPARFLWMRRTRPETMGKVRHWVDVGTYLYSQWFGRTDIRVSYSIGSWMGLLNRSTLRWDEELLDYTETPADMLPELSDYSDGEQGLAAPFSARWPALRDVPFFLSVGDGASANVGSGCLGAGRVALTVGTSGAIRVLLSDEPESVPLGLWAYRFDTGRTLLGGSFSEGGNVFAWARDTLNLPSGDALESGLRSSSPDGHGLTVLPFFAGERSPGWATGATAAIQGLKMSTTPIQIVQAALEAVTYRFGAVWGMLKPFASADAQVIASGGAIIQSPYWLQLMADVIQRPITVSSEPETTSRGTAVLALRASGIWPELEYVPAALGATYEPDPRRAGVYQEAMIEQHRLYDLLIGHSAELTQQVSSRS